MQDKGHRRWNESTALALLQRVEEGERPSAACRFLGLHMQAPGVWARNPRCKLAGTTFADRWQAAKRVAAQFDEVLAEELIERVAAGETQTKVAEELGIAPRRLQRWRAHPEYTVNDKPFIDALAEARAEFGHALVDRLQQLNVGLSERLTGDRDTDNSTIQAVNAETRYAQWYVSKVLWPLYGDRVEHHHSGGIEHGITVNLVSYADAPQPALEGDAPNVIEGTAEVIEDGKDG